MVASGAGLERKKRRAAEERWSTPTGSSPGARRGGTARRWGRVIRADTGAAGAQRRRSTSGAPYAALSTTKAIGSLARRWRPSMGDDDQDRYLKLLVADAMAERPVVARPKRPSQNDPEQPERAEARWEQTQCPCVIPTLASHPSSSGSSSVDVARSARKWSKGRPLGAERNGDAAQDQGLGVEPGAPTMAITSPVAASAPSQAPSPT